MLLDEIEKAHPDVFNILLQVLDDGRLTDGQGRTVDFNNTVVIMTSNLGSELIDRPPRPLGFGTRGERPTPAGPLRDRLMRRLREDVPAGVPQPDRRDRHLPPAGRARSCGRSPTCCSSETRRRLHAQAITVEFTPEAVDWLAERGFQPQFGARPLRRTIQREVDNQLSALLLNGQLQPGWHVTVTVEGDRLAFRIEARQESPQPASAGADSG